MGDDPVRVGVDANGMTVWRLSSGALLSTTLPAPSHDDEEHKIRWETDNPAPVADSRIAWEGAFAGINSTPAADRPALADRVILPGIVPNSTHFRINPEPEEIGMGSPPPRRRSDMSGAKGDDMGNNRLTLQDLIREFHRFPIHQGIDPPTVMVAGVDVTRTVMTHRSKDDAIASIREELSRRGLLKPKIGLRDIRFSCKDNCGNTVSAPGMWCLECSKIDTPIYGPPPLDPAPAGMFANKTQEEEVPVWAALHSDGTMKVGYGPYSAPPEPPAPTPPFPRPIIPTAEQAEEQARQIAEVRRAFDAYVKYAVDPGPIPEEGVVSRVWRWFKGLFKPAPAPAPAPKPPMTKRRTTK